MHSLDHRRRKMRPASDERGEARGLVEAMRA
jgi:hypothetical protein